jgi:hypothetical protein
VPNNDVMGLATVLFARSLRNDLLSPVNDLHEDDLHEDDSLENDPLEKSCFAK